MITLRLLPMSIFKTNLLGLKQMKRLIQVSSTKTAMMGLRKITILSNLSHQIRMADNVCSKVLNVKSMKAQMRNIHGIGGEASKRENIGEVKLTTKRVRANGI